MSDRPGNVAARIYGAINEMLAKWFHVPQDPPSLPVSPGDKLEQFRPAEAFLRYLKLRFWIGFIFYDLLILLIWIGILAASVPIGILLTPVAFGIAVIPDVIAYVALNLRYDNTWYVMTGHSIRMRRGIWTIREVSITFENVQNLHVHQGPVQRYFGISNLVIETAGAGGAGEGQAAGVSNQGLIEGIADAKRLREVILTRVRASTSSGLGDEPNAEALRKSEFSKQHIEALRQIRDEAAHLSSAAG